MIKRFYTVFFLLLFSYTASYAASGWSGGGTIPTSITNNEPMGSVRLKLNAEWSNQTKHIENNTNFHGMYASNIASLVQLKAASNVAKSAYSIGTNSQATTANILNMLNGETTNSYIVVNGIKIPYAMTVWDRPEYSGENYTSFTFYGSGWYCCLGYQLPGYTNASQSMFPPTTNWFTEAGVATNLSVRYVDGITALEELARKAADDALSTNIVAVANLAGAAYSNGLRSAAGVADDAQFTCASFNGVDDAANVGGSGMAFYGDSITTMYGNFHKTNVTQQTLFAIQYPIGNGYITAKPFSIEIAPNGTLMFGTYNEYTQRFVCTSNQITDGWHKITMVKIGTNITFTVDGVNFSIAGGGRVAPDYWGSAGNFKIGYGCQDGEGPRFFKGKLLSIKFESLTVPGSYGYWDFTNTNGTTVVDSSGNGRTITITSTNLNNFWTNTVDGATLKNIGYVVPNTYNSLNIVGKSGKTVVISNGVITANTGFKIGAEQTNNAFIYTANKNLMFRNTDGVDGIVSVQPGTTETTYKPIFNFSKMIYFDPAMQNYVVGVEVELRASTNNNFTSGSGLVYWGNTRSDAESGYMAETISDLNYTVYFSDYAGVNSSVYKKFTRFTSLNLKSKIGTLGYVSEVLFVPSLADKTGVPYSWMTKTNEIYWSWRPIGTNSIGPLNSTGGKLWYPCAPVGWVKSDFPTVNITY